MIQPTPTHSCSAASHLGECSSPQPTWPNPTADYLHETKMFFSYSLPLPTTSHSPASYPGECSPLSLNNPPKFKLMSLKPSHPLLFPTKNNKLFNLNNYNKNTILSTPHPHPCSSAMLKDSGVKLSMYISLCKNMPLNWKFRRILKSGMPGKVGFQPKLYLVLPSQYK